MQRPLQEKIAARSLRVGVIGLGYVGLPLVATFVEAGFHVTGIDTDQQKVDAANRGESYIPDISSNTLQTLLDTKRMYFTTDFTALKNIDAISICVPTPLRKTRDPDISYIISATQQVRAHLHPGQLVVLESTTYPGTTDEVLLPELECTGLRVGVDFFLAFSPERVDPGNRSEEHTSELQSQFHIVCRLLLEKKNYCSTVRVQFEMANGFLLIETQSCLSRSCSCN